MSILLAGIFIFLGYISGSLSAAIIICRIFKLPDPRQSGSNNPGTTNVLRIGGKKAAFLTLLGDGLKGLIPVFVASFFLSSHLALGLVGIAAFLGHVFPLFFRFKGGKGVATLLGVGLGLSGYLGVLMIITWLLMCACFRYSSLAAITMAILTPFYGFFLIKGAFLPLLVMSIILLIKHKGNIQRLLKNEEPKIGKKF